MVQLLLIFAVTYLLILVFFFLQQKHFIFFPTRAKHAITSRDVAEFSLEHNQATLSGWLLHHTNASEKVIIYYGGNTEDIYHALEKFRRFGDTAALLLYYRGYGPSSGSPGETELLDDALTVYDQFRKTYSPRQVYLMGRGLGACIASCVAANRKTDGVILISPFDSMASLARTRFPFIPADLLLRHTFSTIKYVRQLKDTPALVIYGGRDRIVKPESTEKLIEWLPPGKKVVRIEAAEHNTIEFFDEYDLAVLQFIHEYTTESMGSKNENERIRP